MFNFIDEDNNKTKDKFKIIYSGNNLFYYY